MFISKGDPNIYLNEYTRDDSTTMNPAVIPIELDALVRWFLGVLKFIIWIIELFWLFWSEKWDWYKLFSHINLGVLNKTLRYLNIILKIILMGNYIKSLNQKKQSLKVILWISMCRALSLFKILKKLQNTLLLCQIMSKLYLRISM